MTFPAQSITEVVGWARFDGVLFDLDGVITPTADVHRQAWSLVFDEFFVSSGSDRRFRGTDYERFVDGKPRYDGVRDFLASVSVGLPFGDVEDSPGSTTICAIGNRKNELFNQLLTESGIAPYAGSIALVDHLDTLGISMAIVSSSKNATTVLQAAGLSSRFPVVVDGVTAAKHGYPGKPAPDGFLFAAKQLGVEPARAVVVEDALVGVEAGRAGGFGLVVGVDRGAGSDALRRHGAQIVVEDLAELVEASWT